MPRRITGPLAIGLACLGGVALASLSSVDIGGSTFPMLSLTSGILLGALLRSRRQRWPLVLLAGVAAMILPDVAVSGRPLASSALHAVLVAAEATAAAAALRAAVFGPLSLSRVGHVLWLILVAGVIPLAAGVAAALLLAPAGDGSLLPAWRAWSLASMVGFLLAGPITIAVFDALEPVEHGARATEHVAAIAAAVVISLLVFGSYVPPMLRVPAVMLPVFLWAALRLDVGGAAATLLSASVVGLWYTARGEGLFMMTGSAPEMWLLRAQGSVVVAGTSILLFASIASERKQIARERALLLADLQEAGTEIKTLRGMIPICAWCHKVRDDAGFWQVLEAYVHTHTHATLSHGICPDCNSRMHSDPAAPH